MIQEAIRRGRRILHFDSDSERSKEDEVLDLSVNASDMSRKHSEIYTEYNFDFLYAEWLELTDESLDKVSSSSSSSSTDG